jgi:hypothetical protein
MFCWWCTLYPAIILHLNVSRHSGRMELNRTEERRSLSRHTSISPLTHIISCILVGVFRFFFPTHLLKKLKTKTSKNHSNKNRLALKASQHFNWRSRQSECGVPRHANHGQWGWFLRPRQWLEQSTELTVWLQTSHVAYHSTRRYFSTHDLPFCSTDVTFSTPM